MKKQITNIVATVTLIASLAMAGIAGLGTTVTANIPFEFTVSGKTLPAGNYRVMKGSTSTTVIIQNAENKKAVTVIVLNAKNENPGKASLSFRRYGNQYFWAGVSDGNAASELLVGQAERRVASGKDHLAVNETKPELVIVSAAVGQ